jgi:hypothetical protein
MVYCQEPTFMLSLFYTAKALLSLITISITYILWLSIASFNRAEGSGSKTEREKTQ